jgi:hypothetical protein
VATITVEAEGFRTSTRYKESSAIAVMAYDADNQILSVQFTDGRGPYVFQDFPENELDRWANSPSIGGYFNSFVRGNY